MISDTSLALYSAFLLTCKMWAFWKFQNMNNFLQEDEKLFLLFIAIALIASIQITTGLLSQRHHTKC